MSDLTLTLVSQFQRSLVQISMAPCQLVQTTLVSRLCPNVRPDPDSRSTGRSGHVEQKTVSAMVWMLQPSATTRPEHNPTRLTVTHWSVHDLRRTGRTQLTAPGCHPDVAEAVICHMPSGIGGVYNRHGYDQERLDWLTGLSELYEKIRRFDHSSARCYKYHNLSYNLEKHAPARRRQDQFL